MSRHRLVKNMDLDNELDSFDGGNDYDDEEEAEELSDQDKENLRLGTIQVREVLQEGGARITDKEIQDSLWHNYYDIDTTISFLLNKIEARIKKEQKAARKEKKGGLSISISSSHLVAAGGKLSMSGADCEMSEQCVAPFSFADFFKDSPWLNIPLERQAILIPPLYPRGGLLGGASDGAPKISKLQALAAARKKKAQEQKATATSGLERPMTGLSLEPELQRQFSNSLDSSSETKSKRSFPTRKRKDSGSHEKISKPKTISVPSNDDPTDDGPNIKGLPPAEPAEPSAFANALFSSTSIPSENQAIFAFNPWLNVANSSSITDAFSGPSPDDIVIAAQAKASKGGKGTPKTNGEKRADQIASSVQAMKLDDSPKATSKNYEVLKEYEKLEKLNEANFVVIGHVDAGKSTMMGRLLLDLNVVDQRTIERYKRDAENQGKASFAYAWVMDQGTEERSRGVTIDIAMNKFSTSKTKFTILDAPGHKDFVPNMIAGASQADFAVLVIDASTGSFESGLQGQTKEHALLVRSMGVQRLIVAVNKLDTVGWSKERFDEISQQISAFLTSANFQAKNVTFVPCSGLKGDNIVRKSTEAELTSWYTGRTLVEELDNSEPVSRSLTKPLRLTIGDIFRGGVQNPLSIAGRIEAGSLQVADALLAQPSGEKCFIKAIEVDDEARDWAVAGQNVTLHLADIDPIHLRVGDVLCSPSSPINNLKQFTAKVLAFKHLIPGKVNVHRGRLEVAGVVKELVAILDKGTGKAGKKKPRIVQPGEVVRVVVELASLRGVPLEAGARVILRDDGETIASGVVE